MYIFKVNKNSFLKTFSTILSVLHYTFFPRWFHCHFSHFPFIEPIPHYLPLYTSFLPFIVSFLVQTVTAHRSSHYEDCNLGSTTREHEIFAFPQS